MRAGRVRAAGDIEVDQVPGVHGAGGAGTVMWLVVGELVVLVVLLVIVGARR